MSTPVTLTTDFGAAGPFVGVMKAVILRHAPGALIVDLCHHIAPCRPGEAGFWLARCYREFPAGSVHVAVVDPGVGTARAIIACEHDGHVFLAPDNGILPMIAPGAIVHALAPEQATHYGLGSPSRTFHGRDVFAPLAAFLLTGAARVADIGPRIAPVGPALAPAQRAGERISGHVAALDNWGNLITNVDATLLGGLAAPEAVIGSQRLRFVATYGDAAPGALVALVNSMGVVEIACREGSAAALLGLAHDAPVVIEER